MSSDVSTGDDAAAHKVTDRRTGLAGSAADVRMRRAGDALPQQMVHLGLEVDIYEAIDGAGPSGT